MFKHKEVYFAALLGLGALVGGCASGKQMSNLETPNSSAGESAKASAPGMGHYVVKPHDCLWTIAAKRSVYGDAFQWPLLYKANRDLIQDPDLIYPHQSLKVTEGVASSQVVRARKLAAATPQYKKHEKRQASQLAEYF